MDRPPYDVVPAGDTLGLKHLREALEDLEFPKRTNELREVYGKWRMPITGTEFDTLEHWLEDVPDQKFSSPADVALAIARAHPELAE